MIVLLFILAYLAIAAFAYIIVVPLLKKYWEDLLGIDDESATFSCFWFLGIIIIIVKIICIFVIEYITPLQKKFYDWLLKPKEVSAQIDEAKSDYRNITYKN